jgi:photosystem II stability/assembly factor-like uncharacterized protein
MKKVFALIIGVIAINVANAQWHYHNPLPQGNTLRDAYFFDTYLGITVGDHGTVLKTADGGMTWGYVEVPFKDDFYGITFIDTKQGFICGIGADILRTSDGGNSWEAVNTCTLNTLRDIQIYKSSFSQTSLGVAVGDNGFILVSHDRGYSWNTVNNNSTATLYSVYILDTLNAIAVGENGTILCTSNGGVDWISSGIYCNFSNAFRNIEFIDDSIGWIAGEEGIILKTTNAGSSWVAQSSGVQVNLNGLCFCSPNSGFVVSENGTVLNTEDGGLQWKQNVLDSVHGLRSIRNTDIQHCFCVGDNGVIFKTSDAGTSWVTLSSGFYDPGNLDFAGFTDDTHGWTCSRSGGNIFHTNDGGSSWSANGNVPVWLSDIEFTDKDHGWCVDYSEYKNALLMTEDGGISWDTNYYVSENQEVYNRIFFISPQVGWVAGTIHTEGQWGDDTYKYLILKTTNGGQSWSRKTFMYLTTQSCWSALHDLYFMDETHGWAIGESIGFDNSGEFYYRMEILRTTNGGLSWTVIPADDLDYFSFEGAEDRIFFSDQNVGWVFPPYSNQLYKSTDGGLNWQMLNNVNSLSDLYFHDTNNGSIVSQDGSILRSSDGGLSWTQEDCPSSVPLNRIFFTKKGDGWAFGDGSTILHLADTTHVSIGNLSCIPEAQVFAYPNPFTTSATIGYELKENSSIELTIFNHFGQEVGMLVNERQLKGMHQIQWYAKGLPVGIYYYRLQAGKQIATKKLIKY